MTDAAGLDALYTRLSAADEARDPERLASVAWDLYGSLGSALASLEELRAWSHHAHAAGPPGRIPGPPPVAAPAAGGVTANAPR